jgi:arylsulfatase A-like enzyme
MKILVIEASALHLGYLGCYGNDWVATPNLDGLAAEGIVFDQHIADDPSPAGRRYPVSRSIGQGRYQPTAEEEADFSTISSLYFPVSSLDQFAAETMAVIDDWRIGGEALLWINGPDLNPPWQLPDDLQSAYFDEEDEDAAPLLDPPLGTEPLSIDETYSLQNTYAAALTFFDAQLGQVLDRLQHLGELEQTLVCITASHGLPLGEHGMVGVTHPWLHDELVHVPLIVRLPNAELGGQRVLALTQPLDLLPTLLEYLGFPGRPDLDGRSLWPLIRGETAEVRSAAFARLRIGEREERLVRTNDWSFLLPIGMFTDDEPRAAQLYVKPDDRWEVNDVTQPCPGDAERLETLLREFAATTWRETTERASIPDSE